jgi:Tfp pilus assembly protein PilN
MKRMNLLPVEVRPRDGNRRGSSYLVIGLLAASVVAMLAYGLVKSGVRSDETELASLKHEAQEAQARADALSPYGEFADMKDRREQSVRTVAELRFDYERLTRQLTRVLPNGVWVAHLEVAPAPPSDEAVAAGADSTTAESEAVPPAMKISGCAPSQDAVADTLDRLHALSGATDVALGASGRTDAAGGGPALVSGGAGGCTGRSSVEFDATVTLTAPGAAPTVQTTPTSAGTGS